MIVYKRITTTTTPVMVSELGKDRDNAASILISNVGNETVYLNGRKSILDADPTDGFPILINTDFAIELTGADAVWLTSEGVGDVHVLMSGL